MPHIDIYYCSICGLCTNAIEFFRSRGLTFTAHAVDWDSEREEFVDSPTTREMYERCGGKVDFVPQMFIGNTHVKGWKTLKPMIDSGEIDKILSTG